jgi:hypothetical protein
MAKTDARLDVTRNPRTETELAILRNLREVRAQHAGLLYSGSRKNTVKVDGEDVTETRYVLEVNESTLHELAALLSKTAKVAWDPKSFEHDQLPVTETGARVSKRAAQAVKTTAAKAQAKPAAKSTPKSAAQKAPAKATARKAAGK